MARLSCQEINIHGMMVSCHGEIFHITGPFCRESAWQAQEDFHHKGSIVWNFDVSFDVFIPDFITPLMTRFTGPTWGPPGADRPQVGPMVAPWTLLYGTHCNECWRMFEHEMLSNEGLLAMSLSKLNTIMYWEIDTALCYGNNRTCIIIDKM